MSKCKYPITFFASSSSWITEVTVSFITNWSVLVWSIYKDYPLSDDSSLVFEGAISWSNILIKVKAINKVKAPNATKGIEKPPTAYSSEPKTGPTNHPNEVKNSA